MYKFYIGLILRFKFINFNLRAAVVIIGIIFRPFHI